MKPKIVAASGPLKGVVFEIEEGRDFIIGRDPSCDVCLEDDLVSRRHASLRIEADGMVVRDLESTNGTFVNNAVAVTKLLEHADRLKVGSSTFICMTHEEQLQTEPLFSDLDHDRRRSLRTVRAARTETGLPNTEQFEARLHRLAAIAIPAKRTAILLAGRKPGEFASVTYAAKPFAVDRTLAHQVLRDGLAVISNDGNSVMYLPIIVSAQTIGVLYADNNDPAAFELHHLQLMNEILTWAAIAWAFKDHAEWLEYDLEEAKPEISLRYEMAGDSPKMQEVYEFIRRAARNDSSVIILGPTGTGKELVARAIHRNSSRAKKRFVAVSCGALAETLLENELFGHEKGAFTGAVELRKGKLEVADGGTLFLDEVGELSPKMQVVLLRFLQEREFERVGGTTPIKVNVRVIAATNRDLAQMVKDGMFRQDLLIRLQVGVLQMPSLAERRADIPMLAAHFIKKHSDTRRVSGITREALHLLSIYDWPGNIRELEHAIERALGWGATDPIRPEDLPEAVRQLHSPLDPAGQTYDAQMNACSRNIINNAIRECAGDFTEAATMLGLSPSYVHRLNKQLNS